MATVVDAALAFHAIGVKSLWRDEASSALVAKMDWPALWRVIAPDDANSGLYYMLLHWWTRFGTGEGTIRALSAVLVVASVPLVYALGRRLFGDAHGAFAALLFSVNAFVIRYGQEARGYALVLFLVSAASLLFIRAIELPSGRRWVAFAVFGALSVYGHFFAGLVMAAHAAYAAAAAATGRIPWRRVVPAFSLMALLVSPLLVPVSTVSHLNWLEQPALGDLVGAFNDLAGAGGAPLLVAYFLACCLAVGAAGLAGRSRLTLSAMPEPPPQSGSASAKSAAWRLGFLVAWLFVPVMGSFAFSVLAKPVFTPRFLIVALPALVLIGAAGVASLRSPVARATGVVFLVALSLRGVGAWFTGYPKENWRDATAYVIGRAEPGDAIAFHSAGTRAPFEYYLAALGAERRAPRPARPADPWGQLDPLGSDSTSGLPAWLDGAPADSPRVWLVLKYRVPLPERFAAAYCAADARSFTGVEVLLFRRQPCDGVPAAPDQKIAR